MATHTIGHESTASTASRWLILGFICGAVAVLIFHQGAWALLHALGVMPRPAYPMAASAPFGIPQVWSLAFWGGVWGIARRHARPAAGSKAHSRRHGFRCDIADAGGVVRRRAAERPAGCRRGGFAPMAMMIGPIVNAAWGLGTGIGLALIHRR